MSHWRYCIIVSSRTFQITAAKKRFCSWPIFGNEPYFPPAERILLGSSSQCQPAPPDSPSGATNLYKNPSYTVRVDHRALPWDTLEGLSWTKQPFRNSLTTWFNGQKSPARHPRSYRGIYLIATLNYPHFRSGNSQPRWSFLWLRNLIYISLKDHHSGKWPELN